VLWRKIDAKNGRKSLEEKLKIETARLARRRPTKKPKGALSVKACSKREVAWKLSYLKSIKGV